MPPKTEVDYSAKTASELEAQLAKNGALINNADFRRAFLDAANAADLQEREVSTARRI